MGGVSGKEIKNRIRSMEATRQITKAMEMVAVSKLRWAQAQVAASRPYFETLYSAIHQIVDTNSDFSSAYLQSRPGNKVLYIVVAGDRGLAGGYNSNIMKLVISEIADKDATVLPIGKKAVDYFSSRNVQMLSMGYNEAAGVTLGDCFTMAKQLSKLFLIGEYDEVHVAYTSFVSVLSQIPVSSRLLPLVRQKAGEKGSVTSDILYDPDSVSVFNAIIPECLGGILYGALCESRAAEYAARRIAMDSATQKADEMIHQLSLEFNRARQAAITQEITEIVAGS